MSNQRTIKLLALLLTIISVNKAVGHSSKINEKPGYVLSDLSILKTLNLKVIEADENLNVGLTYASPEEQERISELSHTLGRCAGFESLDASAYQLKQAKAEVPPKMADLFKNLYKLNANDLKYQQSYALKGKLQKNPVIESLVNQVSEQNLKANVEWISSFHNRYNKAPSPNQHVEQMIQKLQAILGFGKLNYSIEKVDHRSTPQKSIRLTIPGKSRPDEIVVLGAHFDSINQWSRGDKAPGADDNASGSSNLLEALRVLMQNGPLERTLEFYWYAGEESGLLGSAEIATSYKQENKDVVAVLQLDMTLFPGEGELVIGNVTDFTSAWLRDLFVQLNDVYIGAKLVEDKCGYGCSDHASWYRQGYPTLLPFEATTSSMNRNIHTTRDIITPEMSFKHSAAFSKLAVAFAIELGNSNLRQPNL